ncbi:hypothetical protein ABIA31_007675 [Catenulispora sp. MAP5-51]|uniref:hypothetical protein n=1 Tax=Catenulispora sp. MAP5-51 TaxID=3156298 RepID=UPI00351331E6
MQIVEDSIVGVRAAAITLSRHETPLRFQLYPMLHIGDRGYYREVTRRLRDCDLIVAEGAPDTVATRALTLSYRLAHRNKAMQVETQSLDLLTLGKRIVIPDITTTDFEAGWQRVPLRTRAMITFAAPLYGLWLAAFGTRRWIGKHAALDDLKTNEEALTEAPDDPLAALIMDTRDKLLVDELLRIHAEHHDEPMTVAVVYGAHHMRAVTSALNAVHGYRARDAEWVMVLAY